MPPALPSARLAGRCQTPLLLAPARRDVSQSYPPGSRDTPPRPGVGQESRAPACSTRAHFFLIVPYQWGVVETPAGAGLRWDSRARDKRLGPKLRSCATDEDAGTRTLDPRLKRPLLYRLSYIPDAQARPRHDTPGPVRAPRTLDYSNPASAHNALPCPGRRGSVRAATLSGIGPRRLGGRTRRCPANSLPLGVSMPQ